MCGHYFGTTQGIPLPENSYFNQFVEEYKKYDFSSIPMISIYNAGSILNPTEVPQNELLSILSLISKNKFIKHVILESRPEFINDDILSKISSILKDKTVDIGIGLETSNDQIRNTCINKGFEFDTYIEKSKLVRKYNNLNVLTYLTVKPIFLTVKESIDDVVKSICDIQPYTDSISLEPLAVQSNTLIELLYKNNLYSLPSGWIIKEVFKCLDKIKSTIKSELRIGGFELYPTPDIFIHTCDKCTENLYKSIQNYNSTKNPEYILSLNCECYSEFYDNMVSEYEKFGFLPLEQRISLAASQLISKII